MLAIVESDPQDQLAWNERGLEIALASDQPAARHWEASLRNNRGMALHDLGRDEEALTELERALTLREAAGRPGPIRVARWMVGWALRHLGRLARPRRSSCAWNGSGHEAGDPDPYVFEELELLFRAQGNEERAAHYAALRPSPSPADGSPVQPPAATTSPMVTRRPSRALWSAAASTRWTASPSVKSGLAGLPAAIELMNARVMVSWVRNTSR